MAELTMGEEAIAAGAVESGPVTATWNGPGVNLPLAGAVLLHLALLALALLASGLGGRREQSAEVYPIRLYSVAEVAALVVPGERPTPLRQPLPRVVTGPPTQVALPAAAPQPVPGLSDVVPVVAGPITAASAPAAHSLTAVAQAGAEAPVNSGDTDGSVAPSGNSRSLAAEGVALPAPAASAATGRGGAVEVASTAPPLVLAHPLYSRNPEPEYPPLARRRGLEGTVVLEALITPEGAVGGLTVHQSSGHPLLDEAALKSVKGWRFEPGRRGETPVAMPVLVPVRFGLR